LIPQTIDKVWTNISNPDVLVPCVPGASLTEKIDEDNFLGEVTFKIGPVKAKYNGKINFMERDGENHKIVMLGKGTDAKGKGSADMLMTAKLGEKEGGTEAVCTMEVTIIGRLAQFGSRLIDDVTDEVFNQMVDNFKATLAGQEVDNSIKAGQMAGNILKRKLGFGDKKS